MTGRRDALCALSAHNVPFRAFRRRERPSPLSGRRDLEPDLFPAHIWVHETALLEGPVRLALPEVGRVLLHERGRPLCLPQKVVDRLDVYCGATDVRAVPPYLAMLDLLDGRERLWFVLQTWACWPWARSRPMERATGAAHEFEEMIWER